MSVADIDEPVTPVAASAQGAAGDANLVLAALRDWSEEGWIRRLDAAFGSFMVDLCPQASPAVVLAAALVAHMEGRGHTCLDVDALADDVEGLLGWPATAFAALQEVMAGLPGTAGAWRRALASSAVVWAEGEADDGNEPLVLRGGKLYLRRYWGYEQRVAAQLLERAALQVPVDEEAVRGWLDRLFAPRNVPVQVPSQGSLLADGVTTIDWQKVACSIAVRGRLSVITGGPGTGKTYCAARLLALLLAIDPAPHKLRVALAAPTGKAAARLKQSIEASLGELEQRLGDALPLRALASQIGAARTLHALLGASPETRSFRFDARHPLEIDVLIVDEASMIHLEMMAALLDALPAHARVVLLGDKDQLASVEAGAVLGDLCRGVEAGGYGLPTARYVEAVTGQVMPGDFLADDEGPASAPAIAQQTVMLRESRRFSGPIGQLALAVNRGVARTAIGLLSSKPKSATGALSPLQWIEARSPSAVVRLAAPGRAAAGAAAGGYRAYLEAIRRRPRNGDGQAHEAWAREVLAAFERFRVLCAVREGDWGVAGLNAAIEQALASEGLLARRGEWYEGRPVMVTRNDYGVGVFNGDIGIALRPAGVPSAKAEALRVYLPDGNAVRSVAVSRLANVETAFSMTVHKAQGSEFEHTVLVLPPEGSRGLTRELVYTGITRAQAAFTLVTGRAATFADALERQTRRSSGLPELLAFHNIDPQARHPT